jgi:hypothetical protein
MKHIAHIVKRLPGFLSDGDPLLFRQAPPPCSSGAAEACPCGPGTPVLFWGRGDPQHITVADHGFDSAFHKSIHTRGPAVGKSRTETE